MTVRGAGSDALAGLAAAVLVRAAAVFVPAAAVLVHVAAAVLVRAGAALVPGAAVLVLAGCGAESPRSEPDVPTGVRFLSAEDAEADSAAPEPGFAHVTTPRDFEFPADHGPHPEYRTEWWYVTGNLYTDAGRHFGFELTIFRYALAPERPASPSAWSTNQAYMAHLAVTDTQAGRMIAEERLTRGAVGLAGAESGPLRVWVESWSIGAGPAGGASSFTIDAEGERIALDLELEALKPPVTHGDRGVDPKGPEPGNASYYYSLTRMSAAGNVTVDGESSAVQGLAWMDREWSTSALSANIDGWDWFALQLSDGADLMLYRLRGSDGSTSPFSGGSLVDGNGARIALGPDDFHLEPLTVWQSPRSGVRYPIAWRVRVPRAALDLEVRPRIPDQELILSVRYWEGAVTVEGRANGAPVTGSGYLELAGY